MKKFRESANTSQYGTALDETQDNLKKVSKDQQTIDQRLKQIEDDMKRQKEEAKKNPPKQQATPQATKQPQQQQQTQLQQDSSGAFVIPPPMSEPTQEMSKAQPPQPPNPNDYSTPSSLVEQPASIVVMSGLIRAGAAPKTQTAALTTPKKAEPKKKRALIPPGSFMKGVLLSGISAPTMGKGTTEPVPCLMRVTDEAILPNFFSANLKECFVIADVKGNLASESANLRLNTLACIKDDGTTITRTVKGYVTGENGMEGLPGRVVAKQGALLGRALLAGFIQGVADAFKTSNSTFAISPQGTLETMDPSKIAETSMFAGAGEATKRLADFYMELVSQMVPVIEINAGRVVDMVFTSEVDLTTPDEK